MELQKSLWMKKDSGFIMNNSNSIASTTILTNDVSTDSISPRKRPKRLSISCVERGRMIILIADKVISV